MYRGRYLTAYAEVKAGAGEKKKRDLLTTAHDRVTTAGSRLYPCAGAHS
jgi:hypothetical protein